MGHLGRLPQLQCDASFQNQSPPGSPYLLHNAEPSRDAMLLARPPLAQVYRARVRATGEEVAVKVQRPGAQAIISKVRPPRWARWECLLLGMLACAWRDVPAVLGLLGQGLALASPGIHVEYSEAAAGGTLQLYCSARQ